MPKARPARSGPPRKKQVSEDKATGLAAQFDSSTTRRRIFSEARSRFSQLATDAGVGEMPGWLTELRQEQVAITDEPSPRDRSFKKAAGVVRMSVRHTMQERNIASSLLSGERIPKDEETKRKEKAKIEAALSKLDRALTMDAQENNQVSSLKQTLQELQHSLDPSEFASSIEEIRRMIERLHILESKFDELSIQTTTAKLSDELENLRRKVPDVVSHVRKETEGFWNKLRHANTAQLFAFRARRLNKEHHADTLDAQRMEETHQLDHQKAALKMMLHTSQSWSKIADESTMLRSRGPESGTWLNWWPERDPEGYNQRRVMQFFDTLPPDVLSQQEEDLRDAIFNVFARDDKTWPSLEEVAEDERVRLCKQRCLPEFVSLEEWILRRHHVGRHNSPTSVPSSPRLAGILQAGWTKTESEEKGLAATAGFRGGLHAERPTSARHATMLASVKQATMHSAQSRRVMGLQVAMNEEGDVCCSLEGQHLPSIKPQVGEQKSFGWIKRLEETHYMSCRPTPAGLQTVEEVVAWRVSHKYRRREVDPSLARMWQAYDTIIQPEHMHACQCEQCNGRLNYEIPLSQDPVL